MYSKNYANLKVHSESIRSGFIKKQNTLHINSTFNLLQSSAILTSPPLSNVIALDGRIPGTHLLFCFFFDFLDVLKASSFQVRFDFWKEEKVTSGDILGMSVLENIMLRQKLVHKPWGQ